MLLKKWKSSVLYSSFSTVLCSLSVPQCAVVHSALKQGYDINFCCNNFVLLLCLQLILKTWLFDPPEIRQKNCPIVKRQTPILRDRTSLCEVPVSYWIKQSAKVFSWCSALTLPAGAGTLQCATLYTCGLCPIYCFSFWGFLLGGT